MHRAPLSISEIDQIAFYAVQYAHEKGLQLRTFLIARETKLDKKRIKRVLKGTLARKEFTLALQHLVG